MSNLTELKVEGQKVFNEAYEKEQDAKVELDFQKNKLSGLDTQIADKKAELAKLVDEKKATKDAIAKAKETLTTAKSNFKEVAANVKGMGITEYVPEEEAPATDGEGADEGFME